MLSVIFVLFLGLAIMNNVLATPAGLIIVPAPKEENYSDSKIVIANSSEVIATVIDGGHENIALELMEVMKGFSGAKLSIASNRDTLPVTRGLIIMDVGGRHPAVKDLNIDIPAMPEGYTIKVGQWQSKNVVVLAGRDIPGLYWAMQSFRQLISDSKHGVEVPVCLIRDWPDFSYRSMGGQDSIDSIKHNLQYKINISFLPPWQKDIRGKWNSPDESYWKRVYDAIRYSLPRGALVNQWVEPYDSAQGDNPSQKNIVCSNENDLKAYYNTFKQGLELGNKLITIGIDDHAANPAHLNAQDKEKFGTHVETHAYMVSRIANQVNKDFPGTMVCVIPGEYHSAKDINGFYDKAGVPKNVVIMWTGEKTISYDFSADAVKALADGIEGRRFVIFDNTFAQPLGKGRGPVLFEKYATGYKALANNNKCLGLHVMGVMDRNVRYLIKGMQVADYLWNAKHYNPELSLRRILTKVAGADAVEPLLAFRNNMMNIAEALPVEKTIAQVEKGFIVNIIVTDKLRNDSLKRLQISANNLKSVEATCKNKELVAELKQLQHNAESILEYFYKKANTGKTIEPTGTVSFVFPAEITGGTYFRNYAWKCPKRNGLAIYGQGKPGGAKAFIKFNLTKLPTSDVSLEVEGQGHKGIVFAIRINGTEIIKDKDIFPYGDWKTKQLTINKALLKTGMNTIEFETVNKKTPWIMLAKVQLLFK